MAESAVAEGEAGPSALRTLERAGQGQHEKVQAEEKDSHVRQGEPHAALMLEPAAKHKE